MRFSGNRKKKMPTAEYRKNVRRFAPQKDRESKRASGTIGEEPCASTTKKAAKQPIPSRRLK
jgi:hypothetical protein